MPDSVAGPIPKPCGDADRRSPLCALGSGMAGKHPIVTKPTNRASQDGYALIGALWFLLLATAFTAALMLRAKVGAQSAALERQLLLNQAIIDSALETAAADWFMNGQASRLGQLPGEATYPVGSARPVVSASLETARLDINTAPPEMVATYLQSQGVEPAQRQAIASALTLRRSNGQRLASLRDVAQVFAPSVGEDIANCLASTLSVDSGRTTLPAGAANETGAAADVASAIRFSVQRGQAMTYLIARAGEPGTNALQVFDYGTLWIDPARC